MILGMCILSLGVWLVKISGAIPRTDEELETNVKGNWGHALAYAVLLGLYSQLPFMLVMTLMLVEAPCRTSVAPAGGAGTGTEAPVQTDAAGEWGAGGGSRGGAAISLDGNGVWYPGGRKALGVTGTWYSMNVMMRTVGTAVMGGSGSDLSLICTYAFGAVYLLPRAAARWLAEAEAGEGAGGGGGETAPQQGHNYMQRGRKLSSFAIRTSFAGVPFVIMHLNLDAVLGVIPAQQLGFIYPYLLSFLEYLMVSKMFNDRVVEGHSDEAMSIVGRYYVALIEATRVGLLVVSYTSGATTFQGFVLATFNSALAEVLGRAGVFAMIWEALKLQYKHGWRAR